jgi:superfamily II DNA/RNA helicase
MNDISLNLISICIINLQNDQRQTLLFSATFPQEIQEWANDWLKKDNVMVSNSKLIDANPRIIQEFMLVGRIQKTHILEKILKKEEEEAKRLDRKLFLNSR